MNRYRFGWMDVLTILIALLIAAALFESNEPTNNVEASYGDVDR